MAHRLITKEKIAAALKKKGYDRTGEQCKKIKKLKTNVMMQTEWQPIQ